MNKDFHRMTISQFSELCNVSTQTLRIYDNENILKPVIVAKNHYRYYDISQCTYVSSIKQLQSMGFSLAEIRELLEQKLDSKALVSSAQKKLDECLIEIKSLNQKCRMLRKVIDSYSAYATSPPTGVPLIERLPEREVFVFDVEPISDEISYQKGRQQFFRYLQHHFPNYTIYDIGLITREKNLSKMLDYNFVCDCLFIEKDRFNSKLSLPVEKFCSGLYLSTYLHSYNNDKEIGKNLLEYAYEKNYTIDGDLIIDNIRELSMPFADDQNIFLEVIRLPIRF